MGFDTDAVVGRVRFGALVRCPSRPHNSFCLYFIQVYTSLIFSYVLLVCNGIFSLAASHRIVHVAIVTAGVEKRDWLLRFIGYSEIHLKAKDLDFSFPVCTGCRLTLILTAYLQK